MAPLKNIRHEKFAQAVASSPTQTEAYKKVYPVSNDEVAGVNASRAMANPDIRGRVIEILNGNALGLDKLTERLKEYVYSENEGIGLKAVETGFKLHGAFDDQKDSISIDSINVVFAEAPKQVTP